MDNVLQDTARDDLAGTEALGNVRSGKVPAWPG
jgi:hypothetical protein